MKMSPSVSFMSKPRADVHSSASFVYQRWIKRRGRSMSTKCCGRLDGLYQRGARHFRFVDRTFNLKIATSIKILEFFLARLDEKLFVHFEVIPDHLPDALKAAIQKFAPERLQFEIGIQTWNPEVQTLISRRQDNEKSAAEYRLVAQRISSPFACRFDCRLAGRRYRKFRPRL